MSQAQRIIRETHNFNNRVLRLEEVKQTLLKDTERAGIQLNYQYFINHPSILNNFEGNSYYLHYLIMFSTARSVSSFLKEHHTKYGEYATRLFVNYPLVSVIEKNVVTPIACAALWCNDPEMARVLYYWGADLSAVDVNGKYVEEKYGSYYFNHMNHLIAPGYFCLGLRSAREFSFIATELTYLAAEKFPPNHWVNPGRVYGRRVSVLAEPIPEDTSSEQSYEHA